MVGFYTSAGLDRPLSGYEKHGTDSYLYHIKHHDIINIYIMQEILEWEKRQIWQIEGHLPIFYLTISSIYNQL